MRTTWIITGVLLSTLSAARAQPPLAVYQSEYNREEYRGVHEAPLPAWLYEQGLEFEIVGDAVAADPERLENYGVVLATSAYRVPEAACQGLAKYVRSGGRLLWIDGPARTTHPELLSILGLEAGYTYVPGTERVLRLEEPDHPVCAGLEAEIATRLIGNPAVAATSHARVLAHWTEERGTDTALADKLPVAPDYPAVITTQTGQGRSLVYNWIPWLKREPRVQRLLAQGLYFLLDEPRLATRPAVVRLIPHVAGVKQPEPASMTIRVLAGQASMNVTVQATLSAGEWNSEKISLPLSQAGSSGLAIGVARIEIPTAGLGDGTLEITLQADLAGHALTATPIQVEMKGMRMAKSAQEAKHRHARLAPLLQGTLGDYDLEPRLPNGHVDIPSLLKQIQTAHMNMYDWLIWHSEHDWEDLQVFLPQARERGIKVWVTLTPPSEQGGPYPWSEPYRLDFIKWADEIGKLSLRYDNLVALVIDDFWGGNKTLYTPEYVEQIVSTLRSHNPNVAFLPVIYWPTIGDDEFRDGIGPYIDGIVFPYAELETGDQLAEQLAACRKWLGSNKFLLVNVYASGSSGTGEKGPRTTEYLRKLLTVSREMSDGIRIYCLPKDKMMDDHRYAVAAELYEQWKEKD